MNPLFSIERLVLALAIVLVVGVVCAWRNSAKCSLAVRLRIVAARLLGLTCLAVIALNPGQWRQRREDRESVWAILVDRSLSMSTADADGKTRWSQALRLAEKARSLSEAPGDVKLFTFTDALSAGFDGIILMGCKRGDDYQCHYIKGSELAHTRMTNQQDTLSRLALEPERISVLEIGRDDYARIPQIFEEFNEMIEEVGPNPYKGF